MPLNVIENFSISHLQILDEKGRVDPDLEPVLSHGKLLKLHRAMTLSRMVDSRMLNLQRQGRLGTLPICRGHSVPSRHGIEIVPGQFMAPTFNATQAWLRLSQHSAGHPRA